MDIKLKRGWFSPSDATAKGSGVYYDEGEHYGLPDHLMKFLPKDAVVLKGKPPPVFSPVAEATIVLAEADEERRATLEEEARLARMEKQSLQENADRRAVAQHEREQKDKEEADDTPDARAQRRARVLARKD